MKIQSTPRSFVCLSRIHSLGQHQLATGLFAWVLQAGYWNGFSSVQFSCRCLTQPHGGSTEPSHHSYQSANPCPQCVGSSRPSVVTLSRRSPGIELFQMSRLLHQVARVSFNGSRFRGKPGLSSRMDCASLAIKDSQDFS